MSKYVMQDILMRAKSGLSTGDAQREAHTALYIAKLN
jgi:hypothetical protein